MMVLLLTGDVDEDDYFNGMECNNNYLDKESNNLSNTDKTIQILQKSDLYPGLIVQLTHK